MFQKILLTNHTGKKSITLTMMVITFAVCMLWMVASIVMKIGHLEIRPFDAISAGTMFFGTASLYFGRRYTDGKFTMEALRSNVLADIGSEGGDGDEPVVTATTTTTVVTAEKQ